MKKLWKHEWKYYLFFLAVMVVVLFLMEGRCDFYELTGYGEWFSAQDKSIQYISGRETLWRIAEFINVRLLNCVISDIMVGVLVIKSIFFWLERDSYNREFLSTLPVTRLARVKFHFIMDSMLIVISVSIFSLYLYCAVTRQFMEVGLQVPWMAASIFGEMVTSIAYLLFWLGIINVMECFFVDGFARIVGTIGSIFMCNMLLEMSFELNHAAKWMQNIYGFLKMESPGGCYYQKDAVVSLTGEIIEGEWTHEVMNYVCYYKGELLQKPVDLITEYFNEYFSYALGRLVDFSNVSSYIGYLLGYLALAAVLMGIAMYLSNRQELSKQGFYFVFGRYLFCGLICACVAALMLQNAVAIWHKCLIIVSVVIIFLLLNYLMKPDRKQFKKRKTVEA